MNKLPVKALSIKQPWAWAIIHGGKSVENRTWPVANASAKHESIAIHASKGMTRDEYEGAAAFMRSIGVECPPPDQLLRGGVIGSCHIKGVVKHSENPWFSGPMGLVLENPKSCNFISSKGALGFFDWQQSEQSTPAKPLKWMVEYQ
ncbi:MAG: hypothetical protein P1U50_00890 [Parvibaculaceae bacterium]|nr:hypothetical protein [Parvibaculaceae bacterium]